MENKPFFTIGIPVYNCEKWLAQTLDSILSQDFKNFEIICINDGSTDGSGHILDSYTRQDNRVKAVHRQNGGAATARNSILSLAQGQYIYFIDGDDLMCENALQNAFDNICKNNHPDVLNVGYITRTPQGDKNYIAVYPGDEYFSPSLTKDERAVLMWLDTTYVPSVFARFIKTSFVVQNGIAFNHRYRIAEDCDFVFSLHRKADTICYADFNGCVYFFPREGSLTANINPKSVYSNLSYYSELFQDLKYYQLSDKFIQANHEKFKHHWKQYLTIHRDKTLAVLEGKITKSVALEIAQVTENFIGKHLHTLPLSFGSFSEIIFVLYRIFGIKRTVSFIYDLRKAKGIITD